MNYKMILNTLGKLMIVGVILFMFPLLVGIIYGEGDHLSFLIPMSVLIVLAVPCLYVKPKEKSIYAKEGFVIVSLCWILLSLVGSIPFVISKTIPNFIDALFETASGLTTTGASILSASEIDLIYESHKAIMFWRLFTHWIGGMGILVFLLALFPAGTQGAMHIYRAESPGPSASKFVSKIKQTARLLYLIYLALTILEILLLLPSNMGLYDCILNAFSTAGTGGFAPHGAGTVYYNSLYTEIILSIFMFLYGINFNFYYLILIGCARKAFKIEEVRTYFIIVIVSTFIIAVNILGTVSSFAQALRLSVFQVTSITSSTGLSTADFNTWPSLSKAVLMFLMIVGACGGSTGGGIKVSRLIVLSKSSVREIKSMVHPRAVLVSKLDGEAISKEKERNVFTYFILWIIIVILSTILISIDGYSGGDIFTDFSATLACIGNIGPGFNAVGPMANYAGYSVFSKGVLTLVMLAGRLEIFPMLILFSPRTWKKNQ